MTADLAWLEENSSLITAKEDSAARMWALMEELFPIYRALCNPGFKESLEVIQKTTPIEINEFPSGQEVHGWTIPNEFHVNEAWVEAPDGQRIVDFDREKFGLWLYSRPFKGEVSREELLAHTATSEYVPNATPLRATYYRDDWGVCMPKTVADELPEGPYKVHIDTELKPGFLRIGEAYLPGKSDEEILICSYLCHPGGANDNLSGVVVASELFNMLSKLEDRHYSYRLALWPETIGAITYIGSYPERVKKMAAGMKIAICGDAEPVGFDRSLRGDTIIDRAVAHAMKVLEMPVITRPFNQMSGSDSQHFNAIGIRAAFGTLTRAGVGSDNQKPGVYPPGFPQYHSTDDNLALVRPEHLLGSLQVAFLTMQTIERMRYYKGTYEVTPFLSKYGVFPYHHGIGHGGVGNAIGHAYYHIMPYIDGEMDMLTIADRADLPIFSFDEAVADFKRVGLLEDVTPEK